MSIFDPPGYRPPPTGLFGLGGLPREIDYAARLWGPPPSLPSVDEIVGFPPLSAPLPPSYTASELAGFILSKIGTTSRSIWRVGLTHDPVERRAYWTDKTGSTTYWSQWLAASLTDAQEIECAAIRDGMKGGTGGGLSHFEPVWVYVF